MKKRLLTTVVALACTAACAITLAACDNGGDDTNPNRLTEAQWKEQFNALIDSPDYSFNQLHYDGDMSVVDTSLYVNKAVRGYSYSYYENDSSSSSYLFKKDGIYYEAYQNSGATYSFGTRTHTAAEFAKIEEEDYLSGWNAIVEQALILCRDKFSDFTTDAGTMYDAQNASATISNPFTERDMSVTVGRITVIFQDKKLVNIGFYDIEGDELEDKVEWSYSVGATMQAVIDSVFLPQIKGKSYELTAVNGNSSHSDVTANEGKYIEWKEDGTLEGDISISGLRIADGTMTCGDNGIVVTVGEYTLTGYCMREDITTTMMLTLSIGEGNEITYTFTQVL